MKRRVCFPFAHTTKKVAIKVARCRVVLVSQSHISEIQMHFIISI